MWRFPLKLVRVFLRIVTGFLEHVRAEGGSVTILGILVLQGHLVYYSPIVYGPP